MGNECVTDVEQATIHVDLAATFRVIDTKRPTTKASAMDGHHACHRIVLFVVGAVGEAKVVRRAVAAIDGDFRTPSLRRSRRVAVVAGRAKPVTEPVDAAVDI